MAFFDDKKFLLSHIRHSFITGDDTGVCEAVMLHEILPHRNKNDDDYAFLEELMIETKSELEGAQSFDIVSNMDIYGSHRRRSNTAQRLERLRIEKKSKAKVKVVQWKDSSESQSIKEKELDDYFPIRDPASIRSEKEKLSRKKSLLTKQMQKYPKAPVNPFNEYSRFDARISETNGNSKRLKIYLTMLNEEERKQPLYVDVIYTAKIQDLIGLICWQFTNNQEGKDNSQLLKSNVSNYCLRIAEENGEVDPDFPCLNANELVSKFGFPMLALEEIKTKDDNSTVIKVNIGQVFTSIEVPHLDVTVDYILDAVIKKRKDILNLDKKYVLKCVNSLDDVIDPTTKLSEIKEKEFRLVPLDETISNNEQKNSEIHEPDLENIEATLYKCFTVISYQKYPKSSVEVQIGISGKKVDVTPNNNNPNATKQTSNKFWKVFQPKPTSFNIEKIYDVFIVDKKQDNLPENRSMFKIQHLNEDNLQTLKFEGDTEVVNKLVNKLKYLMMMYSTTSHTNKSNDLKNDWLKVKK